MLSLFLLPVCNDFIYTEVSFNTLLMGGILESIVNSLFGVMDGILGAITGAIGGNDSGE